MKTAINGKYIISNRQDYFWFILPSILSLLLIGLFYVLIYFFNVKTVNSTYVIYFIWILVFDGTHVFATYTRTYLDKEYYKNNQQILYSSLILFLIGPLYVVHLYIYYGLEISRASFIIFNRFCIMFAYYHLIRQHWGFICMYKSRNNEKSLFLKKLDASLLTIITVYPFVHHYNLYKQTFGMAETYFIALENWKIISNDLLIISIITSIFFILFKHFDTKMIKQFWINFLRKIMFITLVLGLFIKMSLSYGFFYLVNILDNILCITCISIICIYFLFYIKNYKSIPINWYKINLLISIGIVHFVILFLPVPYIAAHACLSIFHNVQYHRIIQLHNKKKYLNHKTNNIDFGFAKIITKNIMLFIICAFAFNFVSTIPRAAVNSFVSNELGCYILAAFFWGMGLHHYLLDSLIWRPSKDKKLREVLQ